MFLSGRSLGSNKDPIYANIKTGMFAVCVFVSLIFTLFVLGDFKISPVTPIIPRSRAMSAPNLHQEMISVVMESEEERREREMAAAWQEKVKEEKEDWD